MAHCTNCGTKISDLAVSCPSCGHPGPGRRSGIEVTVGRTEGFAIASLACSVGAFFIAPLVGSILGIVFGNVARRKMAEDPTLEGDGLAKAGIIIGWVGVGLAILFVLVFLLIVATTLSLTF